MSTFEERWQKCTERARQAAEPPVPELEDALVTRVLARAWNGHGVSLEAVWVAIGWRTLAVVVVVLASSFLMELRAEPEPQLDRPAVEDIVADEFWML